MDYLAGEHSEELLIKLWPQWTSLNTELQPIKHSPALPKGTQVLYMNFLNTVEETTESNNILEQRKQAKLLLSSFSHIYIYTPVPFFLMQMPLSSNTSLNFPAFLYSSPVTLNSVVKGQKTQPCRGKKNFLDGHKR